MVTAVEGVLVLFVGVFIEKYQGCLGLWIFGVIMMTSLLTTIFLAMDKLEKTITAQQTQIDDLKRELEELKGKLKE